MLNNYKYFKLKYSFYNAVRKRHEEFSLNLSEN